MEIVNRIEGEMKETKERDEARKKEDARRQDQIINVEEVQNALTSIKDESFGSEESYTGFKTEHKNLISFIDKFTTCSLKNPRCKHIVESVNQHTHTHTCRKHATTCRFRFPRFPSINTEIAVPSFIKYKDPEKASEELSKAQNILRAVKEVLENKELTEELVKTRKSDIDTYMYHINIHQKIEDYLREVALKTPINKRSNDPCIIKEYNKEWNESVEEHRCFDIEKLHQLQAIHEEKSSQINLLQCRKDRLDKVLKEAFSGSLYLI